MLLCLKHRPSQREDLREQLRCKLRQSNYQESNKKQISERKAYLGQKDEVVHLDNKIAKQESLALQRNRSEGYLSRVIVKLQPATRTYKIYERKPMRVTSARDLNRIPVYKATMARTRTIQRRVSQAASESSSRAGKLSYVVNQTDRDTLRVYEWSDSLTSFEEFESTHISKQAGIELTKLDEQINHWKSEETELVEKIKSWQLELPSKAISVPKDRCDLALPRPEPSRNR